MNFLEKRELLEKSDDKVSLLSSFDDKEDIVELANSFLSDEEKYRLMRSTNDSRIIAELVYDIIDEEVVLEILKDDYIMQCVGKREKLNLIEQLSELKQKELVLNPEFFIINSFKEQDICDLARNIDDEEKPNALMSLNNYDVEKLTSMENNPSIYDENYYSVNMQAYLIGIIKSMSEENRFRFLMNTELVQNELYMDNVVELISSFSNLESKVKLVIQYYDYLGTYVAGAFKSGEVKELLDKYKDLLAENGIKPHDIFNNLDYRDQLEFIENIDDLNLNGSEESMIAFSMSEDLIDVIYTDNLPKDMQIALSGRLDKKIFKIDFNGSLEKYRGKDEQIVFIPDDYSEEEKARFDELFEICPRLSVYRGYDNGYLLSPSTIDEYKEAEEWIESVLSKLKPEYTKAQKMAIIDYEFGKRISYCPNFETETFVYNDAQAMWKIMASGYGVCYGIACAEQYVLKRAGIDADVVAGELHAFLRIKDIELPKANGEIVRGDTILDPTWNLCDHRFGAMPESFCVNYEQVRKQDVDKDGVDHKSHENESLEDVTLSLDEHSLRELFKSVGLTDKNGVFPFVDLKKKSESIDEQYAEQPENNIKEQLQLLKQACPEFTTCLDSSIYVLQEVMFSEKNLKYDDCLIDRVYKKNDKTKTPALFIYIKSDELGSRCYYPNEDGDFLWLPPEEFAKEFECFDYDIKRNNRT